MIDIRYITPELIKKEIPNYLKRVNKEYFFFDDWHVFHNETDMFDFIYQSFKDDPEYYVDGTFTTQHWIVDDLTKAIIVHTFWNESGDTFDPTDSYEDHQFYAFETEDHLKRFINCNPDSHFCVTRIQ